MVDWDAWVNDRLDPHDRKIAQCVLDWLIKNDYEEETWREADKLIELLKDYPYYPAD